MSPSRLEQALSQAPNTADGFRVVRHTRVMPSYGKSLLVDVSGKLGTPNPEGFTLGVRAWGGGGGGGVEGFQSVKVSVSGWRVPYGNDHAVKAGHTQPNTSTLDPNPSTLNPKP